MAFTFSTSAQPNDAAMAKFTGKGIYDPAAIVETANKILSSIPAAVADGAVDVESASALVLKYFDSYVGDTQSDAPAVPGEADNKPVKSIDEAGSIPSKQLSSAATKFIDADYAAQASRSKTSYISDIITVAPKPADRYIKDGKVMTMIVNETEAENLKKLKEAGMIPADKMNEYEAALAIATSATRETEIYVNDKARPAIGGYMIHDEQDANKEYPVARKGYALLGKLARLYGTRLAPQDGKTVLGAYIQKRKKLNGVAVVGKKSFVIKFVGVADYFKTKADGLKVWDFDSKTKQFNVKSAVSFTVYKNVKGNRYQADTTGTRTVRLSGKVTLPLLAENAALTDAMKAAGIKVNTGEGGIGSSTMPAADAAADKKIGAGALATLSAMYENGADDLGSFATDAAEIASLLKPVTKGPNDGNGMV